ncbi:unnamed protein product, partial [Nesidiocoris tenuis]
MATTPDIPRASVWHRAGKATPRNGYEGKRRYLFGEGRRKCTKLLRSPSYGCIGDLGSSLTSGSLVFAVRRPSCLTEYQRVVRLAEREVLCLKAVALKRRA